ncbi:hypothetical protein PGRAN_09181 [Listeria grandensis FSL F6-0971]|uniref:Uncharacterized protein n=1 Tax=Listeria grandensis FSL F6-0971 TaxID=1265819 RepID=W7BSQ5_9LIST|nr:hypothetical protein PGRAN_09181 [Listeria grandensis FSL F6-0971]
MEEQKERPNKTWRLWVTCICLALATVLLIYYFTGNFITESILEVVTGFILLANIFLLQDLIGKLRLNKRLENLLQTICIGLMMTIIIASYFLY